MNNRLPAEKRFYRKGLALGMTVAEIFLVLVFALMFLLPIHVGRVQGENEELKDELDSLGLTKD